MCFFFCTQATKYWCNLEFPWLISSPGLISPGTTATLAPWQRPPATRLWFGQYSRTPSKSAETWWVTSTMAGPIGTNTSPCTSNWLHALFSRLTASALCSASPTAHRLSSLITTETSSQPYGSQRSLPAPPARPPEPATPWGWCSWAFFWGGLKEPSNAVVSYQFMELHVNWLCIQGARSSPHEVNNVTTLQAGAWERVALHWVYRGDVVKLQQRNLWDISFF